MTSAAAAVFLSLAAAAAEPLHAEPLHVRIRETLRVDARGATAAYTIDADIAEASAVDGSLIVRGRHAGTTHVAIVTSDGEVHSRLVLVEQPPPAFAVVSRPDSAARTRLETQYESATGRLVNGIEHTRVDGPRSVRLELLNHSRLGGPRTDDAVSAMARASLDVRGEGWRAVLLDARVDHSPLSVQGTVLRGGHLSVGPLELHAGYTSPLWYRGFLLPGEREAAVGASYRLSLGNAGTIAPVAYAFGGEARTRGGMGSLLYELAAPGSPLRIRAEAGWGGKPGGALFLSLDGAAGRLQLEARHAPSEFASLRTGRTPGSSAELRASARLSPSLELVGEGSASRQELQFLTQERETATFEARWRLASEWTVSSGLTRARSRTGSATIDAMTAPLTLDWRGRSTGISAQYRYRRDSLLDEGGHGGRLRATTRFGRLTAGAYVETQQADATIELLFRDSPDLQRLFADLGLEVRTPEDVERLLREQPALAAQLAGASITQHPWRLVGGGDVSWTAADTSRQELRASLRVERARTTRRIEEGATGTLWYGRRLVGAWDVFGSISAWSRALGPDSYRGWSWSAGIRFTFDGLPRPPWSSGGVVEGRVFRDDDAIGRCAAGSAPEIGARVRLDGGRETVTDAEGRFAFKDAGRGDHRVEVVLPAVVGAFHTTPSAVTARSGDRVVFGLAQSPARLVGALRDDSGTPVAGATVVLTGPVPRSARTDSSGVFSLAGPEGDYTLSIDAASLPPGYDLGQLGAQSVRLARDAPARQDLAIRALRSISGTVRGRDVPGTLVWLVEPYVKREVGPDGRYVFRDLAPGRYTIAVHRDDRFVRRVVEVPAGPATIRGVDFSSRD